MACANARYGFLLRSNAVGIAGKSSPTITAAAFVVRAAAAYFGLATKVTWPEPASSIPATPVISLSGEPFSKRAPNMEAICASFIEVSARVIVMEARSRGLPARKCLVNIEHSRIGHPDPPRFLQ